MVYRFLAVTLLLLLQYQSSAQYADYSGAGPETDYTTKPTYRPKAKKSSGGMVLSVVVGFAGSVLGGWTQSRKLAKKFAKEKKELMQYIQMQEDVYKRRDQDWQTEYQKLYKAYEALENETLERDYEEFKAPDTNNDEMISRAEFAVYVKKYLSSFPELTEKDFPKFEEFDLNGDGMVSFQEWQKFLKLQKQQEKAKQLHQSAHHDHTGTQKQNTQQNTAYADLLDAMYNQAGNSDSFNSLNQKVGRRG